MDLILEGERLGFDSVWTAEAYGSDAVSPAAWILVAQTSEDPVGTAIMQMPASHAGHDRHDGDEPLRHLSGGRFILGLGPVGAPGRRGLARRSLRQAPHPHARVHRASSARSSRARKPLEHEGFHYDSSPTPARARRASASR